MKFLAAVLCLAAVATANPVGHWGVGHWGGHGAPLGHDGRVVDTPEVAHAKAAHFAAKAAAAHGDHGAWAGHDGAWAGHGAAWAGHGAGWAGHDGAWAGHGAWGNHWGPVPLTHDNQYVRDTPAVAHVKASHAVAHASASHRDWAGHGAAYAHGYPHHWDQHHW